MDRRAARVSAPPINPGGVHREGTSAPPDTAGESGVGGPEGVRRGPRARRGGARSDPARHPSLSVTNAPTHRQNCLPRVPSVTARLRTAANRPSADAPIPAGRPAHAPPTRADRPAYAPPLVGLQCITTPPGPRASHAPRSRATHHVSKAPHDPSRAKTRPDASTAARRARALLRSAMLGTPASRRPHACAAGHLPLALPDLSLLRRGSADTHRPRRAYRGAAASHQLPRQSPLRTQTTERLLPPVRSSDLLVRKGLTVCLSSRWSDSTGIRHCAG